MIAVALCTALGCASFLFKTDRAVPAPAIYAAPDANAGEAGHCQLPDKSGFEIQSSLTGTEVQR